MRSRPLFVFGLLAALTFVAAGQPPAAPPPPPALTADQQAKLKERDKFSQQAADLEKVGKSEGAVRRLEGDGHTQSVAVVLSPDGRVALSVGPDREDGKHCTSWRLWDMTTGRETRVVRRFDGSDESGSTLLIAPDSKHVLSYGRGRGQPLGLWGIGDGQEIRRFKGHTEAITCAAFSQDGRYLAAGSYLVAGSSRDGSVILWEVATGKETRRLEGHKAQVAQVAFSADGRRLVTYSYDETVRLWDAESGKLVSQLARKQFHDATIALSPDGRRLLTAGHNSRDVQVWDLETSKEAGKLSLPQSISPGIATLAFSPDGKRALVAGSHRGGGKSAQPFLTVFDAVTGKQLMSAFDPPSDPDNAEAARTNDTVVKAAFSADGRRVFYVDDYRASGVGAGVLDAETGKRLQHFSALRFKAGDSPSIVFSLDGRRAVSGSDSGVLQLWDVATGREVRRWGAEKRQFPIHAVAFSPDGKRVLCGRSYAGYSYGVELSERGTLMVYDAETGQLGQAFTGHVGSVLGVAFAPDGSQILSAGADGTVRL